MSQGLVNLFRRSRRSAFYTGEMAQLASVAALLGRRASEQHVPNVVAFVQGVHQQSQQSGLQDFVLLQMYVRQATGRGRRLLEFWSVQVDLPQVPQWF
jgi:hypothetical protein